MVDLMKSGQGGYQLATHGGRVPIPWIISACGWAMFFHQPYGTFDLTGTEGKLEAATATPAVIMESPRGIADAIEHGGSPTTEWKSTQLAVLGPAPHRARA
jgi:hypothetical protein